MNKIGYEERKAVYAEALMKWGAKHQINKFIEELGEFLAELGRIRNNEGDLEKFADELADLTITMEQMRLIFGVNVKVAEHMDSKVERLMMRLKLSEEGAV